MYTSQEDFSDDDYHWMKIAIEEARQAAEKQEIPVGAVLVLGNKQLSKAGNSPIAQSDPSGHAEILALRNGCKQIGNYRLPDATLYVTLEPCIMCMGAILHSRLKRLVFGAYDQKTGAAGSVYNVGRDGKLNHKLIVEGGLLQVECGQLLINFFKAKRHRQKERNAK